jgi:beta-1,4-mannosyl-glycoprotein beta-1,4-N-acetylglucosaminyltransferase
MIVDCFIFFNELKMLKFRLNYLKDIVSYFVICESTKTHSGKPKDMFFEKFKEDNKEFYDLIKHKIIHLIITDFPEGSSDEINWTREKYQRNYLINGILPLNLNDNDLIILSDLDEIPDRETLKSLKKMKNLDNIFTLIMDMYYYNLECRYTRKWFHAKLIPYKMINKNTKLSDIRLSGYYGIPNGGWHFSYFGDANFIVNKLECFAHQEFNDDFYKNKERISKMIESKQDLFERQGILYETISHKENKYLPEGYEVLL